MTNIDLIFQIAAVGIVVALLQILLNQAGKGEMAFLTTLVGVAVVLFLVVRLLTQLFDAVRTMFPLF